MLLIKGNLIHAKYMHNNDETVLIQYTIINSQVPLLFPPLVYQTIALNNFLCYPFANY